MKKIILIFISIILLSGCGSDDNKTISDKFNLLSFEVPSYFKKESTDQTNSPGTLVFSDFSYSYEKMGSNGKLDDSCHLSFMYDDIDEQSYIYNYSLEEYASIYNDNEKGTSKTINGVDWLIIAKKLNDKMTDYEYYAKFNGKFYTVSYSDWGSGNICGDAQKDIENSFKFSN